VRQVTGSKIVAVRRLPGASSTAVHGVVLASGETLALRAYVWPGFVADEPKAPQREVDALTWAADAGLPVPRVIASDPTGQDAGVPVLLMELIRGRAQSRPKIEVLAELAAQIHAVNADGFGHEWFPWCRDTSTRPAVGARDPHVWERAQELWREPPPPVRPTFIHRDLHPGNVLWLRGRPVGIVDWANACRGPIGVDIAHCRWNLDDWAGEAEATAFVQAYERRTGTAHHPYWDLATILEDDWDLGRPAEHVHRAKRLLQSVLARW
jgi:aminoglycoside phosphotransferase (APT) family kinase protein